MAQQLSSLVQNTLAVDVTNITGTIPVAKGGTGATTAASALTNLGAYASSNPSGYTTNTGTVTSVAALTLGTTGTDVTSTVATGTTTPVITLNLPTASATNRGALSSANWTTFNGKQAALGFTPENTANKGAASGYAPLDATSKISATYLPSYVDDVLEYANLAALPATGETAKIYVTLDTNKTYRWSGSAYVEISASPGSTDAVTEGSTNLYFTNTRARAAISATQNLTYNSTTGVITGPVLSSYLTAETDTLATVTARGATTTVVPTFSKGLIAGSSVPFYHLSLDFGSDAAGSWRVLGTVALANTLYSTAAYKITITDPNANHGVQGSVNADEYTYYVACVRTESTTTDSPDLCVVRGPYSHIRAVKTSVGNYQIQVSNEYLYQEYLITIQCYANNANANAITFLDGTTAGGAGTAVYAASVGAATEHFQKINTLGGAVIQGLTVGLGPTARAGNTALGVSVLTSASATGTYNTAVGTNALQNSTSGSQNLAIGASALQLNTFGNANSAVGVNALYNNLGGFFNASFGASSLYSNTSGAYNSAIGTNALQLSTGSTNTVLGYNAGSALTTGSNNTIIGSVAGTAGLSDTVIIAAGAAERMRIDSSGNVGIGTTSPTYKLDISGNSLGTTAGNQSNVARLYSASGNADYLEITNTRTASGGDWTTAGFRFQQKIDATWMAWQQFNGYSNTGGITWGTGLDATSAVSIPEKMRLTSAGNLGIGTTSPGSKLTVAGQIESTVTGFKFPDGTVQATAASGANWTKITTTTTATTKKQYVTDTTAGAFTVTLPASPAAGDYVYFMDAGNWAVNNLTVARNGSTIEASATDLVLDVRGLMVQLIFDGTTWQVMSNIGPQGPIGPAQGVGKVIAMAMIFGG